MRSVITFLTLTAFFSIINVSAQRTPTETVNQNPSVLSHNQPIESISNDLSKITKSVENLSKKLSTFFDTFSSNQGLILNEKQQRLLLAFEILNRAEQRLANLQKLKFDISEKQSIFRLQLAKVTDDALPESIDRYVSTRGTTNTEQIRDIRRQTLIKEKYEITNLLNEIQRELENTNHEIRQTEVFLRNIRQRVFPEIEKELSVF